MIHTGSNGTWSRAEDLGGGLRWCDFNPFADCPPEGFAGGKAEKCWHWDEETGKHVEELCYDAANPLTRDLQRWSQTEDVGPPAPPAAGRQAPASAVPTSGKKGSTPSLSTPPPSPPGSYPLPSTSTVHASMPVPKLGSTTFLWIGAALLGAAFFVSQKGQ